MRLDHVLTEGEAVNALRELGYAVEGPSAFQSYSPANTSTLEPNVTRLYLVKHARLAGERVFTVAQLCAFAEGCTLEAELVDGHVDTPALRV